MYNQVNKMSFPIQTVNKGMPVHPIAKAQNWSR